MNKPKHKGHVAEQVLVTNVPVVFLNEKIADIEKILEDRAYEYSTINYIYVIDEERKLHGVLSIKDLFKKPNNAIVSEVMTKDIVTLKPENSQRHVALTALKHGLKSIPIIDDQYHFVGVIPPDVIFKILHEEHNNEILQKIGIQKSASELINATKLPASKITKIRIPWLILGLIGGIIAAQVVSVFEGMLEEQIILATFIPVIVYIGDAVGGQTEMIFVRNMAIDKKLDLKEYFWHELKVALYISVILSTLFAVAVAILNNSVVLGVILWLSMFTTIISAVVLAILIPGSLRKVEKDPAVSTGPFATIVRDILSIAIYFSVAQLLLNFLQI